MQPEAAYELHDISSNKINFLRGSCCQWVLSNSCDIITSEIKLENYSNKLCSVLQKYLT